MSHEPLDCWKEKWWYAICPQCGNHIDDCLCEYYDDMRKERKEQDRRNEKRGLHPQHIDPSN